VAEPPDDDRGAHRNGKVGGQADPRGDRVAALAHAYEGGRRFALVELTQVIDFDLPTARSA
jgi:hypothetical protein